MNPFSGKKKATKVISEIKPLFEISGHKITIIETKNRFHALEYVKEMDLKYSLILMRQK